MKLQQLAEAGRTPALPAHVQLPEGDLCLLELLRVLPGQRYVARAEWQGRPVLAKLLVGGKAERHYRRELAGAQLLAEQSLATPALLAQGFAAGQGGWLLFEFIEGAQSLWDAWHAVASQPLLSSGQQSVLAEALGAIAAMHRRGLWQSDLHLDNLLRHQGRLLVIDGGGVQAQNPGQALSRQKVLENLGVFFAQLPAELDAFIEELLIHYLLVNGEHALPLEALYAEIVGMRRWRLRDYLKKISRDCSLFSAKVGAFGLRIVRRDHAKTLQPLLDHPDSFLARAKGQLLKDGGSATVARVELDGRQVLVKRYNLKSFMHRLKRFWRPSRAWHCWREGNRLQHLGIATPLPLAVLESRCCWLRGRAWLVTEYCRGQDILSAMQPCLDTPPEKYLLALDQLFAAMRRERISHGDLKGTNLLWDETSGVWTLIDLDAMQQHRNTRGFSKAYARDRARFLRNWPVDSAFYQLLDERLP
jgi:tRNA A-37 threonylcarbamoyl transferase component Bud32